MAGSLNKVMIIGNVGRDPEMRYIQSGAPVTTFSVAVNHVWTTPEGDRREDTEWFRIVAWRRLAETCNNIVTKGQQVYVEGRLKTRAWQGTDGQKRTTTELVAERVVLLGSRPRTTQDESAGVTDEDIDPDNLPFEDAFNASE